MNGYQKTAVFTLRLVGFALFFVGLAGLLWFAMQSASSPPNADTRGPWPSLFWVIAGAVAYTLSKPVGWFLGRGL